MRKQERIYSHIIIAVFCGWRVMPANTLYPYGYIQLDPDEGDEQPEIVSKDTIITDLPYETDWNYFMKAWDKFSETVKDGDMEVAILASGVITCIVGADLSGAFRALVKGINYINKT